MENIIEQDSTNNKNNLQNAVDHTLQKNKSRINKYIIILLILILLVIGINVYYLWQGSNNLSNIKKDNKMVQKQSARTYQPTSVVSPISSLKSKNCINEKYKYNFELPTEMECINNSQTVRYASVSSIMPPEINITMIDKMYMDYPTFEENIRGYSSYECNADGPMSLPDGSYGFGSLTCPIEYMIIEEFKNKNELTGYRVKRKKIYSAQGTKIREEPDEIVFFPVTSASDFAIKIHINALRDEDRSNLQDEFNFITNSFGIFN